MSLRIRKRPRALLDLIETATYLEDQTIGVGLRFLTSAEEAFDQIAEAPSIGRLREFAHEELRGMRSWRIRGFEKWLVFYLHKKDRIEVVRVLHGARDLEVLFKEEEA